MDITTFNGDKWVDITDNFRVKAEYPNREQKYKLKGLQGKASKIKNLDKYQDGSEVSLDDVEVDAGKQAEFNDYFLKCVIKDWEGLSDGGEELKCKVVDNELDDELWDALCRTPISDLIFDKVWAVLRWNDIDKKK